MSGLESLGEEDTTGTAHATYRKSRSRVVTGSGNAEVAEPPRSGSPSSLSALYTYPSTASKLEALL